MMKYYLMVTFLLFSHHSQISAHSIEGQWLAPSTKYHPQMVVRLSINHNILYGQILWVDKKDLRFGAPAKCTHCRRPDQNKSLENLVVLWRLRKAPDAPHLWTYGKALSPTDGSIYMASLKQTEKDQLNVSVYWGLPFFGETFQWSRKSTKKIAFLDPKYRSTYDDKNNIFNIQNRGHHLCLGTTIIYKKYCLSFSSPHHKIFLRPSKVA